MGNILIPIFWKDLTPEAKGKVEKYLKTGGANIAAWTKHFKKDSFPLAYITLKKTEDK